MGGEPACQVVRKSFIRGAAGIPSERRWFDLSDMTEGHTKAQRFVPAQISFRPAKSRTAVRGVEAPTAPSNHSGWVVCVSIWLYVWVASSGQLLNKLIAAPFPDVPMH